MDQSELEEYKELLPMLRKLKEKYKGIGQDFTDYLQGLTVADGLKYWDYIHIDALLGLQMPRTPYKDEIIFITYHQICELYFKLIKLEISQLTDPQEKEYLDKSNWVKRISRINNYFKHLCNSFDIMKSGMDRHDFKAFRMALLPASGFQAAQFRHIEIMSTNLNELLPQDYKGKDLSIEELYDHIYWKAGGIDLRTQTKTLTLLQFEERYDGEFLKMIKKFKTRNIAYLFDTAEDEIKQDDEVKRLLKEYDQYINVYWKLSHLMASGRHLPGADQGTGGTNWRKYLPPKFQRVTFFESIWTETEKKDWAKEAVTKMFKQRIEKDWMKPT